ncbi:MAG: 5'-nucleotidase C-terminal domain-containing protein [Oscillospiraceae bacterium]|nr:5'-nucleotidase C-terminal domain-containing protein [Oscillospiraceae bacterium]
MQKSKTKRILALLLTLFMFIGLFTPTVSAAKITADNTSIVTTLSMDAPNCLTNIIGGDSKTTRVITWQMPNTVYSGKIMYGTDAGKLTNTADAEVTRNYDAGNSNTMRVTLKNLTSGTTYYYKAGIGLNWSPVYSFTTDNGEDFSFIQLSDTQDSIKLGSDNPDLADINAILAEKERRYDIPGKSLSKILADGSKYSNASFLLETGDLIEIQNSIKEGENEYRWMLNNSDIKDVLGNYAFFPVMGNHDSFSSAPLFSQFFTVPHPADFMTNSATNNRYNSQANYSFNYGKVHFVVINSESLFNQTDNSYKTVLPSDDYQVKAVQNWLTNDLQKNSQNPDTQWIIVAIHRELFGTTSGGSTSAEPTYKAFWKILSDYGADLILDGHSHTFMKTYPQTDNGKGVSVNAASGIVSIECGGSGIKQGPETADGLYYEEIIDKAVGDYAGIKEPTYNYISVSGDKLTVEPIYVDNWGDGTVKQVYGNKAVTGLNSAVIEIPYTFKPESLTITPISDKTKVTLAWYSSATAGDDAAVQFSTDPMFASGVIIDTKIDVSDAVGGKKYHRASITGFAADTTYYYRVSNDGTNYSKIYTYKAPQAKTVIIFHTNDLHGSVGGSVFGMDKIAAYKNSVPNSLLVDAGDATQGNAFATLTKGADVITLMNMAGYDVMTAGNHEFDYGLNQLLINAQAANFPILSANTVKNGKPVLQGLKYAGGTQINNGATYIKEVNGVKVGFFGITTPETATKTNPEGIVGVTFGGSVDDIKTVSLAQIQTLKTAGADVIVGIMHLGIDPSSDITSEKVAAALSGSGVDIIIDGHSHSTFDETVGGIYIAQTGSGAANLGKIQITMNKDNQITNVTGTLIKAADAKLPPVKKITDKYNSLKAAQDVLLAPVIGKTSTTLWGGTVNGINEARAYETNLGDLVADAMLDAAKSQVADSNQFKNIPVVALQNGGGVRTVINAGDITKGDVISVLPFGNSLAFKIVTPDILYKALENAVGKITAQDASTGKITGLDGRFPQIAGMRFEFDPTKTATTFDGSNNPITYGNRVTKIVLLNADGTDGETLSRTDTKTKIILASNDFEIAGGDGYIMLKGLESVGEGGVLDQVVSGYITKMGTVNYPIYQGRIKTVGAYTPKNYNAFVIVNDTSSINKTIEYKIDGVSNTGTVDTDGKLSMTVSDGPHTISISGQPDVLVNNYSGAGFIF